MDNVEKGRDSFLLELIPLTGAGYFVQLGSIPAPNEHALPARKHPCQISMLVLLLTITRRVGVQKNSSTGCIDKKGENSVV